MPKIVIPTVTEEEFNSSGSKFITFPAGVKVGDRQYRKIEVGMLDWDTPGQSMKVPITVTEDGPDLNKQEKLSFGVSPAAIWKGKGIYKNVTGKEPNMVPGSDGKRHPEFDGDLMAGKEAVGVWEYQKGKKGGVGEEVFYPKLVDILPPGSAPKQPETLM